MQIQRDYTGELLVRYPNEVLLTTGLAEVRLGSGDEAAAEVLVESAIKLDPLGEQTHCLAIDILEAIGETGANYQRSVKYCKE